MKHCDGFGIFCYLFSKGHLIRWSWFESPQAYQRLMVGVAQMVRVPGCGPGGRGFDPLHSPHYLRSLK